MKVKELLMTYIPQIFDNHSAPEAAGDKPLTDEQLQEQLARIVQDKILWKAIRQYVSQTSNPELFMHIRDEKGMNGYWYIKGYIRGQRDFIRRIETAAKKNQPVSATPERASTQRSMPG